MIRWSNVAVAENKTYNVEVWLHPESALITHALTEKWEHMQTPDYMMFDDDAVQHTRREIHNI